MTPTTARLLIPMLVGVCGCGPPKGEVPRDLEAEAQRFAEAFCGQRAACGCDDPRFSSTEVCELEIVAEFMSQVDRGLTFNAECFDALLASEAMTCAPWPWDYEYWACAPLQGTAAVGEPCQPHWELLPLTASECGDGLTCQAGVCVVEIAFIQKQSGDPCVRDGSSDCGSDLYCGFDDICHPMGQLGEACTYPLGCDLFLYCEGLGSATVGVCAEQLGLGEPCDPLDANSCALTNPPAEWAWCAPPTYTCSNGQPGLCRLSYPFVYP